MTKSTSLLIISGEKEYGDNLAKCRKKKKISVEKMAELVFTTPEILRSVGITVYVYRQQVGYILIQFSYTYHARCNVGNNLNEACN